MSMDMMNARVSIYFELMAQIEQLQVAGTAGRRSCNQRGKGKQTL